MADPKDIWPSLTRNYEFIEGAQISNSFICLLALKDSEEAMSTTDISKYIAKKTGGQIYKVSATIKESLEKRLKKAGYVEGLDIRSKKMSKGSRKQIHSSRYRITSKGIHLLKGWYGFMLAFDERIRFSTF